MSKMDNLRTGAWLTVERIQAYSWILIAFWAVGLAWLVLTLDPNLLDFKGRPFGADFAGVWTAGDLALHGSGALAYDISAHHEAHIRLFNSPDVAYFGWHYPPVYLMIAAVLASLPYTLALGVWMVSTFSLYWYVLRSILPYDLSKLAIAAFPGAAINLINGQNGFLTTGLLGLALLNIERRAVLSGIAIGLMIYKPQFGVLIPLVLVLSGKWRTFMTASFVVLALFAVVTAVFGVDVWAAFLESTKFTQKYALEAGGGGQAWFRHQSVFAAVRLVGGDVASAYTAQVVVALVAVCGAVWLWVKPVSRWLQYSGLICAALLVTPYFLDYDLVLLALPLAWVVRHGMQTGFIPWEKTILAFVWCVPLISRTVAEAIKLPIGIVSVCVLLWVVVSHARYDLRQTAQL